MAVNLGLLGGSCYFFISVALQLSSRGGVEPAPDPLLVPVIETETPNLLPENLTTRPQKWSHVIRPCENLIKILKLEALLWQVGFYVLPHEE
jgi:hypothetical protein